MKQLRNNITAIVIFILLLFVILSSARDAYLEENVRDRVINVIENPNAVHTVICEKETFVVDCSSIGHGYASKWLLNSLQRDSTYVFVVLPASKHLHRRIIDVVQKP
jgi:hypothetical protein